MDGRMSDTFETSLKIRSQSGDYGIEFMDLAALELDHRSVIIVDSRVKRFLNKIQVEREQLIEIEASEENKNLEQVASILAKFGELNVRRQTLVYAIGGGVIQDLATLSSSLYMRGIKWIYVPTTLMSALDSCVGGKSSINVAGFKNIVGNFYPPTKILIDVQAFATLDQIAVSAGIAEGVKICFARGKEAFHDFVNAITRWRLTGSEYELVNAIMISLTAKKWFIETDEFDQKERKLLNFGHSFGHAVESASRYKIPHGIAILIGMKAAIRESRNLDAAKELDDFISNELSISGILSTVIRLDKSIFISALSTDKKNSATSQTLILPNFHGILEIVERDLNSQNLESCWNSLLAALNSLGAKLEVL